MPYRGFIFFGLMITKNGPKVLEYNCRLGDPETQSILLRGDFDFAQACMDAATGKVGRFTLRDWFPGASACVVIASEGYPENPVVGQAIRRDRGSGQGCGGGGVSQWNKAGGMPTIELLEGERWELAARGDTLGSKLRREPTRQRGRYRIRDRILPARHWKRTGPTALRRY